MIKFLTSTIMFIIVSLLADHFAMWYWNLNDFHPVLFTFFIGCVYADLTANLRRE